ncbi:hypothetical protein [Chitinophaga sp. GbtcB8]|uniref:hypothetical protein n=1 Tax=Chitinophaga sp. GbtcB8 TaxID=2824753 RepID=UPI001C2FBF2B|nr:hypothetical protein [Chitinophaga sp. GbtcB8]
MKQYIPVLVVICLLPLFSQAQTTQTFDKVGIGITPINLLHVVSATEATSGSINTYDVNISQGGSALALGGNATYSYLQSFNSKPLQINLAGNNTLLNAAGLGNVGIGTVSPAFPLHVVTASGASGITAQSTVAYSTNSGAFVRLYNSGTPTVANQRLGGVLFGSNPAAGVYRTGAQIEAITGDAWTDGTAHASMLRFLTAGLGSSVITERMRINGEGNIQVQQGTQFGVALTDRFTYDGKIQPQYGIQWLMDSWSTSGPTLWAAAYGGMKFFTQGTSRMIITGSGNVGIGTEDTKGYKFAVNGDAMFTKIKVKTYTSWPDYVFADDYQLPALSELAGYIQQHKHLPDMPTAAEVEKEGLDVAEMNKKLLQKVEELTLYLLKMEQQHRELKEEIEILKNKIN